MSQVELADEVTAGRRLDASTVDHVAEIARLEAEIVAVQGRLAEVRRRIESRQADRAAIQAELAASREAFAAMEREHEAIAAEIRRAAQDEVDRIRSGARSGGVAAGDLGLEC